jgi:hypothetical protein
MWGLLSPEDSAYRCLCHSGKHHVTPAKQGNGLPHRSEKQKHERHDQQHIDAGGGEETGYDVALKDSLEVSGARGVFLRSFTRGH